MTDRAKSRNFLNLKNLKMLVLLIGGGGDLKAHNIFINS